MMACSFLHNNVNTKHCQILVRNKKLGIKYNPRNQSSQKAYRNSFLSTMQLRVLLQCIFYDKLKTYAIILIPKPEPC